LPKDLLSGLCVTRLIQMCHVTRSYLWHDSFRDVRGDSFIRVRWLIRVCDVTHSYLWHDSFICVTWRSHVCWFWCISVTWLIHIGDMIHSYVWYDLLIHAGSDTYVWRNSFICVTWFIHMCHVTYSYTHMCDVMCVKRWIYFIFVWERHDSFVCVTWLIRMCDMTHSYFWRQVGQSVGFALLAYLIAIIGATVALSNIRWVVAHT